MFKKRLLISILVFSVLLAIAFTPAMSALAQDRSPEAQTLDGYGNNAIAPEWGSIGQQFLRLSDVDYADGISAPTGTNRPSPRVVSNALSAAPAGGIPNARGFTAFTHAWGQFIDHDIVLSKPASSGESLSIIVPPGDPWFDPSNTGTVTMQTTRSSYDARTGISTNNPREQFNSITAFIDGSQIYGVDDERSAALREFLGGRLRTSAGNLLPFNTNGFENANDAHLVPDDEIFLAGDVRANENPELLSLHILFVREHNRLAAEAARENPTWTDEELYQYARRVVIAELQHITYDEFLPALLGSNAISAYSGYNANVNPGIATEFSTAAFRLGHSMLGEEIRFLNDNGNQVRSAINLRDAFFNPTLVQSAGIDPILKYLATDIAQEIDTMVIDDVRNFLFGAPGQGGFDLASLNIQRGRDHGLTDYNTVRQAYGLSRVTRFDQITSDPSLQATLAATYGSVDNIDLWIGGLTEDHLPNSSLGITFTRILVDQFTRLRDGDRFWYENTLPASSVREIQNTSLADIVHRNTDLTSLQENVFFFTEEPISTNTTTQQTPQNDNQVAPPSQNDNPRPPRSGPRRPPRGGDRPPRRS
ncbi:MAG: peroxidase [Chloroflexi bacterium]|nr:peroxidase [Chloroflexota bacterium]